MRLIPILSLAVALALPGVAAAASTDLGVKSSTLDVAMTKDGAAHVAYIAPRASLSDPVVVKVCRIPTGATACSETASLSPAVNPSDTPVGPWVLTDGTKVVVVVGNSNGLSDGTGQRTFASTSTDGTGTGAGAYSPLAKVATIEAKDAKLSPAGDHLWITAASGPTGTANDYLAFASVPLPAGSSDAVVLGSASGGRTIDGQLLGVTPDGKPIAFEDGNAPDLMPSGNFFVPFNGSATSAADLKDKTKFGAPVRYELGDPFARNGEKDVSSGNGKLWLTYEGLSHDTVLRQYTGSAFGNATSPDCTDRRFSSGLQEAPDVAITRTNDLLITEVGSDGTNEHLGFFHANADATAFSPYTELATGPAIQDVQTAADPTSDTGGVAVWTSDHIHAEQGELSFIRLPSVATAGCAVATPTPSPTPTPTVSPTPTPSPTKTATGTVGGTKLTLTLPNTCAAAGSKFTVKLAYKKGKKAKLKKVVKVVFSATGNKKKTDKKKPYAATFTIPKSATKGAKVTVKAKATVKLKHKKKSTSKTVKASFVVC